MPLKSPVLSLRIRETAEPYRFHAHQSSYYHWRWYCKLGISRPLVALPGLIASWIRGIIQLNRLSDPTIVLGQNIALAIIFQPGFICRVRVNNGPLIGRCIDRLGVSCTVAATPGVAVVIWSLGTVSF